MKYRLLTAAFMLVAFSQSNARADLLDGDFETPPTPSLGANNYVYNPTGANLPWTFAGQSGLTNGSNAFGNVGSGNTAAFLQYYNGANGVISQTFSAPTTAGTYTLSFSDENRGGYAAGSFSVNVDGVNLGTFTGGSSFTINNISGVALLATGNTITFTSLQGAGNDTTTFIDSVIFAGGPPAVPEPASIILLGSGLTGLLVAAKRRKRSA